MTDAKKQGKTKARRAPKPKRARDPRLPAVGTLLTRDLGAKKVRTTVMKEGFEFEGKTYASLSAVAKEATGTVWNGYLFFRLTKPVTERKTVRKKGTKA